MTTNIVMQWGCDAIRGQRSVQADWCPGLMSVSERRLLAQQELSNMEGAVPETGSTCPPCLVAALVGPLHLVW